MSLRLASLLTTVVVLIGVVFLVFPSLKEQTMIRRLGGPDNNQAYSALAWLVQRHGAKGLELGYAHGNTYIQQQLPAFVKDLYLPLSTVNSSSASWMQRRLTGEEAFALLLCGLANADVKVQDNAAFTLGWIQGEKPLVTVANVDKILPLLDRPFNGHYESSPLWRVLEDSTDPAVPAVVSDDFLVRALAGHYPSQALGVLELKYKTRKVRWVNGDAGIINLPNPLLLKLLQSPDRWTQINACQQLASNYDAVASHTLAAVASSDPMPGASANVEYHYAGPALRHNRAVEKEMGISTTDVLHALDAIYRKSPDHHFPEDAACGPYLWYLLTGEKRN